MFRIKQWIKMILQNIILPLIYRFYAGRPVEKGLVLLADAHHREMPFSMERMAELLKEKEKAGELHLVYFICDFNRLSFSAMALYLIRFMKSYARAEKVFICDYYLPVSSCKKRKETQVIQLWHSCGLMKKIAYDTGEDIPRGYKGNMFANYSLLTLSAPACVPVHAKALHLSESHIEATGVSRTDFYFDPLWNENCKKEFYGQYPQAEGKKILLWAPTFRGNAAHPYLEGLEEIRSLEKELGEDYFLILKAHPHVDAHGQVSNCDIPTERLLGLTDILITDYSSVFFDYLICGKDKEKAAVLYAPDLKEYEAKRGFYLSYRDIPFEVAETGAELLRAIKNAPGWAGSHKEEIAAFRRLYTGSCDGQSTQRIYRRVFK